MLSFYLLIIDSEEGRSEFEKIYNQYNRLMLSIAYDILKDRQLAEDAVQDAFLQIAANIHKIETNNCHKTKAYVVVVIENISKNAYKKLKRNRAVSFDTIEELGGESTLAYDDKSFDIVSAEVIAKKIEQLPKIYGDIFILKYINGLNDKEIAKIVDISEAAVRKRNERARKALADLLKEEAHNVKNG